MWANLWACGQKRGQNLGIKQHRYVGEGVNQFCLSHKTGLNESVLRRRYIENMNLL
jgi:hypothetical protein